MSELIDDYTEALGALTDVDFVVAMHIADGIQSRSALLPLVPLRADELGVSLQRLHRAGMLFGDKPPLRTVASETPFDRPRLCLSVEGYRWVGPARAARRA